MTSRDTGLRALRPSVPANPDVASSDLEAFLHQTLRPVLKLQNPVLLQLVASALVRRVPQIGRFAPDDRRSRVETMLRTDARLKQTLLGVVFGVLTESEMAFALSHDAEVRRRVVALLTERILSQSETLSELVES